MPFRSYERLKINATMAASQLDLPNHNASLAFPSLIETIPRLEPFYILTQGVEVDSHFWCIDDTRANLPRVNMYV